MAWLDEAQLQQIEPGFERRPIVFVEDHLYHTADLVAAVAAVRPDLLASITAVGIDRPGPDTDATIVEWRTHYPSLQIVAPISARGGLLDSTRVRTLEPADTAETAAFARTVARLLRPGGLLIQDVQLSTLPFVPADRWWESIYLAATVRGMFASRPPTVRFLSNKRGYSATFGRDLLDAGFDPRDVMDKSDLSDTVVPAVIALFDRAFPQVLEARLSPGPMARWPVGTLEDDRREIEQALDLVVWPTETGVELGGRSIGGAANRIALKTGSPEAETWTQLVADALGSGPGLPVLDVGKRIGPAGAERAELTNVAARHAHTLRGRLRSAEAIVTENHAYRLSDSLRVGRVTAALLRSPSTTGTA
jgi:hypothetical protein